MKNYRRLSQPGNNKRWQRVQKCFWTNLLNGSFKSLNSFYRKRLMMYIKYSQKSVFEFEFKFKKINNFNDTKRELYHIVTCDFNSFLLLFFLFFTWKHPEAIYYCQLHHGWIWKRGVNREPKKLPKSFCDISQARFVIRRNEQRIWDAV